MYRTLLGVSKVFVSHRKSNVPHVACNVWPSGNVGSLITTSKSTNIGKPLSHTLRATCGTLPFNEERPEKNLELVTTQLIASQCTAPCFLCAARPTVSSVAARPGFNGNFVPKAKGVT